MTGCYKEVGIQTAGVDSDILIAFLSAEGYEGFEEEAGILKAYIPDERFNGEILEDCLTKLNISLESCSVNDILPRNWNEIWEKSFEPVVVGSKVTVRAPFHEPVNTDHEIIIEPKMAFGTGHHETTCLMMEMMLEMDFAGKRVVDFGCGTGILAILASMLGAEKIIAVDNDEVAVESVRENAQNNNIINIIAKFGTDLIIDETADIILANINRNIILQTLGRLSAKLNSGGYLLISGILKEDSETVQNKGADNQLLLVGNMEENNWIGLKFQKR